jgi:uncharacterized membrane protein YqgA involved in biofilm formation
MLIPWGAIVNALAIIVGSLLGMLFGARLSGQVRAVVFQGLGLCLLVLGIQMSLKSGQMMIMIFSILIGGLAGTCLRLEERFAAGAGRLKEALRSSNPNFAQGVVSASMLFCVGAMAVLGGIDEGLRGDRSIYYTKGILDGCAAVAMAAALGGGVAFSSVFVFAYEATLTVLASSLQAWLTPEVVAEFTATGGVLILGIGLNMLELTRIRLANLLPALALTPVLCAAATLL